MPRTDPEWDAFVEWVRERPPVIQELMLAWPPLAAVVTKPGVLLLVPAPGVEGSVESWLEDGRLGVVAPLTIPHPEHGFGTAKRGDLVIVRIDPTDLELVRTTRWTVEDVREAIGA